MLILKPEIEKSNLAFGMSRYKKQPPFNRSSGALLRWSF